MLKPLSVVMVDIQATRHDYKHAVYQNSNPKFVIGTRVKPGSNIALGQVKFLVAQKQCNIGHNSSSSAESV